VGYSNALMYRTSIQVILDSSLAKNAGTVPGIPPQKSPIITTRLSFSDGSMETKSVG
jgi:hypothetical protein